MITQLKARTRADRFLNDVRANQKSRRNYGRYFYIVALLAGFAYLGNLFGGHLLWLRAEGLVLSDHVIIASPYAVQVTRMEAQPGQAVTSGVNARSRATSASPASSTPPRARWPWSSSARSSSAA